ncbi:hypothetical protein HELRODRAFT_77285, partial [Helobdella robusta]|uniref:TLC domain-containing protein n=1 Tax=Helobdella robusta TaxID=6412 RepID=T1G2V7_HELRO
ILQPLARYLKLNAVNIEKFPESAWKLTYYIIICSYLFHVMVWSGQNDIVQKPYNIWNDYYSQKNVPLDIGLAFLLEFSYYLHSLYGTLYLDSWRKDSPIMLFHHLLCLLLIGFSYATRYHKVGILLMFVHDYCDVFLEFSKCQVYMKYRNGKYHRLNDIIATFSFLLFTILWFVGRLYYFPIMVIRSSSYSTMSSSVSQPLPFYLLFNVLLWFMLALNVYWFIVSFPVLIF